MNTLVVLPLVAPLVGAGLVLLVAGNATARRTVGLLASGTAAVSSILLLAAVEREGPQVVAVAEWGAPVGIVLVADLLAVLMLAVSTLVVFATQLHAITTRQAEDGWGAYHAVHLLLGTGMALSLLTGDLFTLFVGFEVALVASFVLLVYPETGARARQATPYVVANLAVSATFLTGVAGVYAATGTVNMADLAGRWPELDAGLRTGVGFVLFVAFSAKAAAFPLFGWLPTAYRAASVPVAAMLAGLLTKLGVYALLRTHTLLGLTGDGNGSLLLWVSALTMATGVFGALAQTDVRRVLAFHIVSQIGYMLFGLALLTRAGVAGAVFYVVHHILVKTALFLVAGMIEERAGDGELDSIGGLLKQAPWLAALFAVPALSLAGIPPMSGFTAKLLLVDAGLDAGTYVVVAVSLLVSLLTILSMAKIWAGAFWGEERVTPAAKEIRGRGVVGRVLPTGVLVVGTLFVSFGASWLVDVSDRAAGQLLQPQDIIAQVLDTGDSPAGGGIAVDDTAGGDQ